MRILIVDDEIVSRKKLKKILEDLEECEGVENGEDALKIARSENPPDLILSNLILPGIDGYELCERLKADERTSDIPVILIRAKSDPETEAKGLQVGAVDYITKPFSPAIVKARVRTHLNLKNYKDHLEELVKVAIVDRMIAEEKVRSQQQMQLIQADKLASIGRLAAGVAHEVNNPTTFVNLNASTMEKWWKLFEPIFDKAIESGWDRELGLEKLPVMASKFSGMIQSIQRGAARISSITGALKDFARPDNEKKEPVDIRQVLESAAIMTKSHYKHHADLVIESKTEIPNILGNSQKLEQVFINLVINASDAVEEKGDIMKDDDRSFRGRISITTALQETPEKRIEIVIKDNGIGMYPDVVRKVFDPFFTTKSQDRGTGLGMSIVYGIIQDHGGNISAESTKGEETTFTVTLPPVSRRVKSLLDS